MALCTFDREAAFFDVTPVENLFIEEYLRAAPGDFVKVYLFGLKQCYHPAGDNADLAGFARAVGLPAARVEEAFAYWCRQGAMRREGEGYAFVNLKGALLHGSGPAPAPEATPEAPSPYRAFNRQLTQACPGQIFSAYEMNRIYDWIEVFGLPQEVVLILIAHYAEKWRREKGKPVPVAYLDKVAKSWAEEGVTSVQAAREKTERSAAASSGAAQVLSRLGIRRLPTAEELALYEKWTGQMGFAPDGVIAACADTARLRQPSFADLDRTLGRLAELELSTGSQIKTYLAEARRKVPGDAPGAGPWASPTRWCSRPRAGPPRAGRAPWRGWPPSWSASTSSILPRFRPCSSMKSSCSIWILTCRRCSPGRAARISPSPRGTGRPSCAGPGTGA